MAGDTINQDTQYKKGRDVGGLGHSQNERLVRQPE